MYLEEEGKETCPSCFTLINSMPLIELGPMIIIFCCCISCCRYIFRSWLVVIIDLRLSALAARISSYVHVTNLESQHNIYDLFIMISLHCVSRKKK